MMKKIVFATLLICFIFSNLKAQNLFPVNWKFCRGDNLEWAKPSFNDQEWKEIGTNLEWEKQGYGNYDGFAWYRASVFIPSTLKIAAKKYGGLNLSLGRIDDVDYTYLNGELLGKTGELPPNFYTKYSTSREYFIPCNKIIWNQSNLIAVRVFDGGGGGGLCQGKVELVVRDISDFITISPTLKEENHVLLGSSNQSIPLRVTNSFSDSYSGTLKIQIQSDFKQIITTQNIDVKISKNSSKQFSFLVKSLVPGFYKVLVTMENEIFSKEKVFYFAYEPEKVLSQVDSKPDFQNYWERARKELDAVAPQYKIIKKDSLCTETKNVYLVEMRSLGNILIRGWYSVPKKPGKYAAILKVQGYSSFIKSDVLNYGDDFVSFALNIRGHGNSKDDVNPGFPGYLQYFINDKELYIYRGAFMDCIRAVDFLCSRAEVDSSKIVVEGGSQGGALTFATAALDSKRIKLSIPQIPFLSDFPDYFKVGNWPGNEFKDLVENEKKISWENVFYTLSYIDIKNLAPMIKAPMLMASSIGDEVCPPHINFAAYNNVRSPKEYVVFPNLGHDVSEDFGQYKLNWIRKKLGMD